jgi:hypothetical protein
VEDWAVEVKEEDWVAAAPAVGVRGVGARVADRVVAWAVAREVEGLAAERAEEEMEVGWAAA